MKLPYSLLASTLLLHSLRSAQVPTKQGDRTLGGSEKERLNSMQPTRDGGSILASVSESPEIGNSDTPAEASTTFDS